MRRIHLFEFEDEPWLPPALRNYMTDVLQLIYRLFAHRTPMLPMLCRLLDKSKSDAILDLCSGSSGPMASMLDQLESKCGRRIKITLSDKYPNLQAFEKLKRHSGGRIDFCPEPVDAASVPRSLPGVRTLFLALHHFGPDQARGILEDAARQRRAIGVFEITERSPVALLAMLYFPLLGMAITPLARPVRATRLLFTYTLPVVPLLLLWDSVISCLRTYSTDELRSFVGGISAPDYAWEIGRKRLDGVPLHVTYLLGYPKSPEAGLSGHYLQAEGRDSRPVQRPAPQGAHHVRAKGEGDLREAGNSQ